MMEILITVGAALVCSFVTAVVVKYFKDRHIDAAYEVVNEKNKALNDLKKDFENVKSNLEEKILEFVEQQETLKEQERKVIESNLLIRQMTEKVESLVESVGSLTGSLSNNLIIALENSNGLIKHFDDVLSKELYTNDPILNTLMTHCREFRDSLEEVQNVLRTYSGDLNAKE